MAETEAADVARLAANLDALGTILDGEAGRAAGRDLHRWADSLRRGDGWGLLQFLDRVTAIGRYDEPGFAGGRFANLLVESEDLARRLRGEAESAGANE